MNAQTTQFSIEFAYPTGPGCAQPGGSIGRTIPTESAHTVMMRLMGRGYAVEFEPCRDSCRFEGWMRVHMASGREARKLHREFTEETSVEYVA